MRSILFLGTILLLLSCNKSDDNTTNADAIIFGHFYGECGGEECIEIFKYDGNKLLEDTLDRYPRSDGSNQFSFIKIEIKEGLKDDLDIIRSSVPNKLFDLDPVVGMPDYADGGGVFIQLEINGETRWWLIDNGLGNVPEELHDFVENVRRTIREINS